MKQVFTISLILFSVFQLMAQSVHYQSGLSIRNGAEGHFYKMVTWDDTQYQEYAYSERTTSGTISKFMNWRVIFPPGYDPNDNTKKYPMIVMLHGAGESGRKWTDEFEYLPTDPEYDNNGHHLLHGGKQHLDAVNRPLGNARAFPGIVIFPQVSYNGAWDTENKRMAILIIERMIKNHHADPFRVHLHGLSNGAKGTWSLSTDRPDLITSILPMSGVGTDLEAMTDSLVTMPVWLFQGGQDINPSPGAANQWINKLVEKGGQPRFTLYPDLGHGTWNSAYNEPDFFSWMLVKSKREIYIFGDPNASTASIEQPLKLGFSAGFNAYEWRRNGLPIAGANERYYTATEAGVYTVRFLQPLDSTWAESYPLNLTGETNPGDLVYIPDLNLKSVLITNSGINTNGDTEIQYAEAAAYSGQIKANGQNIASLVGLEAFTSLTDLRLLNNQITAADLSANTALVQLHIQQNQLTSLDLSLNTQLTHIRVFDNDLFELNVQNGNNVNFSLFHADQNDLTCIQVDDAAYAEANFSDDVDAGVVFSTDCDGVSSEPVVTIPDANFKAALLADTGVNTNGDAEIQVIEAEVVTNLNVASQTIADLTGISAFTALTHLDVSGNQLTSLDVTENVNLQELYAQNNLLSSVLYPSGMITLDVTFNLLSALDIGGTSLTTILVGSNALTLLNLQNGMVIEQFFALDNPDLECVQVDDVAFAEANWSANVDAGVSFSTDCNDVPEDISLDVTSIDENNAVDAVIGDFTTLDADTDDTHTYSLVSGTGDTDNASFSISGNELLAGETFDHETKSSYSIRVMTDDGLGGTYEESFTITINDVNDAPGDLTLAATGINENEPSGTMVCTLSSTNDAGDSYSLVSGTGATGNASFSISSGSLFTAVSFDFETQSSYSIRIQVSDGNGGTYEEAFMISVNDVSETPTDIILSASDINENNAVNDVIGSFSTTDEDAGETYTYSLITGGTDNASFSISGSDLLASESFNFETRNSYSILVQTDDGNEGTYSETFTINVNDVNDDPVALTLSNDSIQENNIAGATIGSFSTDDEDVADSHSYTFVAGTGDTDNASFTISGSDLQAGSSFDYETRTGYEIRVQTADGNGGLLENAFTINITNEAEAPTDITLSDNAISESVAAGTVVGALSTTDPDNGETYTYTLVSGTGDTDNTSFNISGSDLVSAEVFDYETKTSYTIRIQTSDGTNTYSEAFTINITDVPPSITDIALDNDQVNENEASGTLVGNFSTLGEDVTGTYTYSLISGTHDTDNASFTISSGKLYSAATFDYELKNSYHIRVETNDGAGSTFEEAMAISVIDMNELPTDIALSGSSIDENNNIGDPVGTLSTTDEDQGQSYTYTLVPGKGNKDNSSFTISADQLLANAAFDYESDNSYTVRIQTDDNAGGTYEKSFTVSINDLNEAPAGLVLSSSNIDENQGAGTTVGTISTTDEDNGVTFTYSLVAGTGDTDNASFSLSGDQLLTAESFDFETKDSYSIRLSVEDGGANTYEESFTITVNDIAEAPTDITLDNAVIDENSATGTLIGTFSSTDEDALETHTYSLVSGTGDTDNASFTISDDGLRSSIVFDYETQNSYSIRVQVDDGNGGSYQEAFTITINDENESIIVANPIADQDLNEGFATLEIDLTDVFEDLDGDALSYQVSSSNTGVVSVSHSGTALSVTEVGFGACTITVTADDGSGITTSADFVVTVNGVNTAPVVAVALSDQTLDEGFGSSTVDLSSAFTDADGDALTRTASSSDEAVATVAVSGTTLTLTEAGPGTATITVTANDGNGGTASDDFIVTVNGVNNTAPIVAVALSDHTLNEGFGSSPVDLSSTFTDADGDALTLTAFSSDEAVATVAVSGTTLTITEAGLGTATITVTANDGNSGTVSDNFTVTVTVTVNGVNTAPVVATALSDQTLDEGFGSSPVDLSGTFTDADGDALTLTASSSDEAVATVAVSGTTLTITEAGLGIATVTVTANDGNGETVSDDFIVTVTGVNTAPVVATALSDQTLDEGFGSSTVDLSSAFADPDGDALTLTASSSDEAVATVAVSGITLTITEAGLGTATITVTANDGNDGIISDDFTVTVNGVNTAPVVATVLSDQILDEGFGSSTVDLSSAFTDPDGDVLTLTASSNDEVVATVAVSGITLTLTEAGLGTVTVTVTANDGNGGSVTNDFIVTVHGVNEAPLGLGQEIEVAVYPNPVSNYLHIDAEQSVVVRLADLNGRELQKSNGRKIQMNLSTLPRGTYLIIIQNGEQMLKKRIIKAN